MLREILDWTGLIGPARRVRNILWARRFTRGNREFLRSFNDGLPIPPAHLRILVAASPDIAWFIEGGRRGADSIRAALHRNDIALVASGPVLDFGCGCGRVARHFRDLGPAIHGSDLNPALVKWCRRQLTFGRFEVNRLAPPLPFADQYFGLVWALSVFTHLPEALQTAWMAELHRIVRPGGHVLFTTHGSRYLSELTEGDRAKFKSGHLVIRHDDRPGSNVCGAYHPEAYVRGPMTSGFRIVDFVPEGATGNPHQDLWLLRRV